MSEFISFDEFLRRTARARLGQDLPPAPVADATELEKMRAHIQAMYQGVKSVHSYLDEDGQYYDCIPADEQPGLRQQDGSMAELAAPPPPPPSPGIDRVPNPAPPPPPAPTEADEFGNRRACPAGTVPMRRLTLEEMTRFRTADDFFRKGPSRAIGDIPPAADLHRHALGEQTVDNFGGSSILNLWAPVPAPGVHSLSQIWCVAGPRVIHNPNLQTVEAGWQVYPTKYGHSKPVLFTYWTSDGYGPLGGTPSGAYNQDKSGFILATPPSPFTLGGAFPQTSTPSGAQYEVSIQWLRDLGNGNWWLFVGYPPNVPTAVGYYPQSLFGSGLMATKAQLIQYGGEVASALGGTATGQMGSGALAAAGYGKAAYQRAAVYFSLLGIPTAPTLAGGGIPGCYTLNLLNNTLDPTWGTHLFFGGPSCP